MAEVLAAGGQGPIVTAAVRVARLVAGLVAVAALAALVAGCGSALPAHQPPRLASAAPDPAPGRTLNRGTIVVDGRRAGPAFQGLGAISGGGGNSRLLIDYPPRQRTQILNYLVTPLFGASLQPLKLDVRGRRFSSDGSEPSVEPVRGQLDCGVGY